MSADVVGEGHIRLLSDLCRLVAERHERPTDEILAKVRDEVGEGDMSLAVRRLDWMLSLPIGELEFVLFDERLKQLIKEETQGAT